MTEQYHKIQTVFKRDMENDPKRLLEGEWTRPEFAYLADKEWVWTEKVDGTNIRIIWDGDSVDVRGKSDNAQVPGPLLDAIDSMGLDRTLADVFGESTAILYGEGYGPKIQGGGKYRDDPSFILFDVFCGGLWLERENVEDVGRNLGLDVTPVVGRGTLDEAIEYVRNGMASTIASCDAEGLVLRPAVELQNRRGERIITKVKVRDFKNNPTRTTLEISDGQGLVVLHESHKWGRRSPNQSLQCTGCKHLKDDVAAFLPCRATRTSEGGFLMYDHDEAVKMARRHGLCVPRPLRYDPQPFQRFPETYCEKTGKRIRPTDGYCNGCVQWNQPSKTEEAED